MKFDPVSYILSNNSTNININKNIISFLLGNSITKTKIIQQPVAYVGEVGSHARFKVVASGKNLTYQWQYSADGINWTNSTYSTATKATLSFTFLERFDKYLYHCIVTGTNGTVISDSAILAAGIPTEITVQPIDSMVARNQYAQFSVTATGENITYQWQYSTDNGKTWQNTAITGNKTDTLRVQAQSQRDGYLYRCKVSGLYDIVISDSAMLSIFKITVQPVNYKGHIGDVATFHIEATGENLTYQWEFYQNDSWRNTTVEGNKTDTITMEFTEAQLTYKYRCKVTYNEITLISNEVQLIES